MNYCFLGQQRRMRTNGWDVLLLADSLIGCLAFLVEARVSAVNLKLSLRALRVRHRIPQEEPELVQKSLGTAAAAL